MSGAGPPSWLSVFDMGLQVTANIAAVDLFYGLLSKLLNPSSGPWILRIFAAGCIASVGFAIAPGLLAEYQAAQGIDGAMNIDHCTQLDARSVRWSCHGSFDGNNGDHIRTVSMIIDGGWIENPPTGTYAAAVASTNSTTAYQPGSRSYLTDTLLAVPILAVAGLSLYWSLPGVMARRTARRQRRPTAAGGQAIR